LKILIVLLSTHKTHLVSFPQSMPSPSSGNVSQFMICHLHHIASHPSVCFSFVS
jgi:hypothetical protein